MSGHAAVTGRRAWLGALLVTAAVLTAASTLVPLVGSGTWLRTAGALVVLLAALMAWSRQAGRSRLAPTAWGAGAGLVALAVLYSGPRPGPSLPVPSSATLRRVVELADQGVQSVADGRIPLDPGRGLEMLLVAGVVLVVVLTDLLALGLGRAGLAGLPLAALWAAAVVFERLPGPLTLALGGLTFLLLLAVTRPGGHRGPREAWPAVGAAALVTVVALVAAPALASLPFYGSAQVPAGWGAGTGEGPTRVSIDLDMRASLTSRSDRPLLTYTTTTSAIGPLRLYTMVDFDGRSWHQETPSEDLGDARGDLWPTDDPRRVPEDAEPERVEIVVDALDQDRLPIPVHPRRLDVDGWAYDPARDEVVSRGATTRGTSYVVDFTPQDLTADALREDSAGGPGDVEELALAVPGSPFEAEIRALAAEVTAGASTTYDQALALQSYLRSPEFTYDPEIPPARTDDAVWDFLTERRGYCVQYATTMTVLARTLGIPARLAVGFLPGRSDADGRFAVTGRQSHAWPELYFEGSGWVRFEPTPATQTGSPPRYADPLVGTPSTGDVPTPGATPGATSAPSAPAERDAREGGRTEVGIGDRSVPLPVALTSGAAVVLVLAAGVGLALRRLRRRHRTAPGGPEVAWERLRTRTEAHGVRWEPSTTPRQAAAGLRDHYGPGNDDAREALASLLAVVERSRYSPEPLPWTQEELDAWVDAAGRPVEHAEDRRPVG